MGMLDKFKRNNQTNDAYEDNYDDYYDGFDGGYDETPVEASVETQTTVPPQGFAYTPTQPQTPSIGGGMSLNGAAIELKVVKPTEFKDGPAIAEHLLNKRTVVLNLEDADKDTSRRLIDFLFGVAYSIGGEIKKVANNAYVITPQNVAISNDKAPAEAPAAPATPVDVPQQGYFGY
ncbi:MAG: cell division protein SepF [Clostridia bacterium]|nr:cell division protein SepF [Clostridia bacterium]